MTPTPDWPVRDLLSHRVDATPTAEAVVAPDDGRAWRYDELDRLVDATASRLAAALQDAGTVREAGDRPRIVVTAGTDVQFAVASYAAWRCGAQLVPIAGDRPHTALASRLDRLEPDLVVAHEPDSPPWSDRPCPVCSLDRPTPDDGAPADSHDTPHAVGGSWSPDETALILFTSGTTGEPKGVRLTHGTLVASAVGSATRLGLDPAERWLDCLPTNHMGGLAPIVRSTVYGTTVILQSGFDARATAEAMAAHDATAVSLVPTQLRRLLDRGWTPPASLRFVLLGGAPASPALLEDCAAADVPVCPTYGTTETASQIATAAPGEALEYPERVGSPLVVADVTIVDRDDGTPVDRGSVGELVVDGPIVTPGYLDETATERAMGPDGLHTGDLASRDEDGRLRIHGRVDDAIQTGGETVHPWRVAGVLEAQPAVESAVVVAVPDPEWGEQVAALVVPATETGTDETALLARCREELAPYAVPKTLEFADELPRTASGTVDRGAVRDRLGT